MFRDWLSGRVVGLTGGERGVCRYRSHPTWLIAEVSPLEVGR